MTIVVRDDLQRIRPKDNFVYKLLTQTKPSLCLDVGAAAGGTAALIKQYAPDTHVVAFEPFPGNLHYFREATKALSDIELIAKAVSNNAGSIQFFVPHVVPGDSQSGGGMAGYSSVGMVLYDRYKTWSKPEQVIDVQTCTLDEAISRKADFLKIDVQGGEFEVLDGAHRLLDEGIDVIFSEFVGDRRVLELLHAKGYDIFDTEYMVFVDPSPLIERLHNPKFFPLSTGARGCIGYLADTTIGDRGVDAYCAFFKGIGAQTDLLAVKRHLTDQMLSFAKECATT